MSNHFTGRSLGPPLGDQRLDLCDLYAFQSPGGRPTAGHRKSGLRQYTGARTK
jgi:hypothetical protein